MHDVSHASTRLRDLFALCDELDRIAERLDDGATPRQTERLMQEKARARRRMRELLAEGLPEPLHRALGVRGRGPLGLDEAVLLLLLLNRRIRDAEPGASGRELLWTVCDNAYEVLAALPLLGRDSDLLRRGLVVVEDEGVVEADALDRVFQFSPYVFDSIAGGPGAAGDGDGAEPRPFADDADFMLALNGLARAYQRRAAKVFGEGHWCEFW